MSNVNSYPTSAKLFHWVMALMIISMLLLGVSMVQSLAPWHAKAIFYHRSVGVLVLVLVLFRLANRLFFKAPKLPLDLPRLQVFAAHLTQVMLYTAMITMPLSGWLMQSADGRLVSVFGLFNLPPLIHSNLVAYGFFRELHSLLAWSLIIIILMHAGAALYHRLIRKDKVLQSMLWSAPNKKNSHKQV